MFSLHCGDCLDVMPTIPARSVDLVLADPPYGTTTCKWDSVIPLDLMWAQLKRIIKPNGAIVMTASQPFTTALISSNLRQFKYCLIWEKGRATGFLNANRMPLKAHEDVCIFYQSLPVYNPQKTQGHKPQNKATRSNTGDIYGNAGTNKTGGQTDRFPRSVFKFSCVENGGNFHTNQKPLALMEYLIKTYTNPGETVLDFTMGSGTTGVACVNTGRDFIGIELEPDYFDIACQRIQGARELGKSF